MQLGRLSLLVPVFVLAAQTTLTFEVASLKRASITEAKDDYSAGYAAGARRAMAAQGLRISGRDVRVTDNNLRDLIRLAYGVKDYQIAGPPWIDEDQYEILAVMPPGSDRAQAPEMLRGLLEQRFRLAIREEKREMPVFALVEGKTGTRLTKSAAVRGIGFASRESGRISWPACSLACFADQLSKVLGRPVVDATGIAGLYDFDLRFTPGAELAEAEDRPGLDSVLRDQLGLRLERRKMPIRMLVIEHADRAFQEN